MSSIDIKKKLFVDHIVLTVSNIKQTNEFYEKILGVPDEQDKYSIMYLVGETKLFLVIPNGVMQKNDKFNPNRIGLEHLAFGIKTLDELIEIENHLNKNLIINSGIHFDKHSKKEKIWLNDPDGIRIEFFIG